MSAPDNRGGRPESRSGRRIHLLLTVVALAAFVSLGHAPSALAQLPDVQQELASVVPHAAAVEVPAVAVPASQIANQVAQVAQAAGANAEALQAEPRNVATPAVASSPGADAVASQANEAAAAAESTNGNAIAQGAGQAQGGEGAGAGAGAAGGTPPPAQAATQDAGTGQVAGAQAVAVQNQPVNIAIPIVINSPNSHTVVVQANNAAAAALASNQSTTTQVAGQTQRDSGGASGAQLVQAPGAPRPPPGQGGTGPVGAALPQLVQESLAAFGGNGGSIWIWIWDWTWNWTVPSVAPPQVSVPDVRVPTIPTPALPVPMPTPAAPNVPTIPASLWTLLGSNPLTIPDWTNVDGIAGLELPSPADMAIIPGLAELFGAPPAASGRDARDAQSSGPGLGARAGSFLLPWTMESEIFRLDGRFVSSSFVQRPATEPKTAGQPPQRAELPFPIVTPGQSVPTGAGGGGASASGLVVGALLIFTLQLASAAFALGRRFDLASAAWRRQAYLSPLERPG
jgi:hypothetical protein